MNVKFSRYIATFIHNTYMESKSLNNQNSTYQSLPSWVSKNCFYVFNSRPVNAKFSGNVVNIVGDYELTNNLLIQLYTISRYL